MFSFLNCNLFGTVDIFKSVKISAKLWQIRRDLTVAFAAGMLPHHIGAVKMAEVELKYGKDPEMRKLAEDIINAQQAEIEQMQKWLKAHNKKK